MEKLPKIKHPKKPIDKPVELDLITKQKPEKVKKLKLDLQTQREHLVKSKSPFRPAI